MTIVQEKRVKALKRNSINISIGDEIIETHGATRFGGLPDVPIDFQWPEYFDEDIGGSYHIKFIAQINCAKVKLNSLNNFFPKKGLLSFFYDIEGQPFEGESNCKGCVRVFLFENINELVLASYPSGMNEQDCLPCLEIQTEYAISYPSCEDYEVIYGTVSAEERKHYYDLLSKCNYDVDFRRSKILGWPDVIQNSMMIQLKKYSDICESKDLDENWILLLQLSSFHNNAFELSFGDCGVLYFYIMEEDLKKRNFSNIRIFLQC